MIKYIHKLTDSWHELGSQKQIYYLLLVITIQYVSIIALGIKYFHNTSQIDIYRERVNAIESRIDTLDQRLLEHHQRTNRVVESLNNTRSILKSESIRNDQQDRAIESTRGNSNRNRRPNPPRAQ
jgi:hypothetical protein